MAQTSDIIRSGRPGNASDPFTTGKGIVQIENGTFLYYVNKSQSFLGNSCLTRFGLGEKFEISLITDLSLFFVNNEINYGEPNLSIKYNWIENSKEKFSYGTTLSHNFNHIFGGSPNITALNIVFTYQISSRSSICLKTRLEYLAEQKQFGNLFILNAASEVWKRNFIYSELTVYKANETNWLFRAGWFKQFSSDFQLDASVSFDQINIVNKKNYFLGVSFGFAYRKNSGKKF